MASFLYCSLYCSSNNHDDNSCRSFSLLKAIAKTKGKLIAIVFKSKKERQLSSIAIALVNRAMSIKRELKQRNYNKKISKED